MNSFIKMLIDAGMIQFGSFGPDRNPISLNFHLLPSYPEVLQAAIQHMQPLIGDVNRLLCFADAMPVAVGLSLHTSIPVVYSRGEGEAAVYDFVGAYDIGHPVALVTNVLTSSNTINQLAGSANGVGLNIQYVLAILNLSSNPTAIEYRNLITIDDVLDYLRQDQHIREPHLKMIERWINPHPG